ncbi:MAG: glycosyltransferase family 39 protein [Chloroflexi bacterium]|nr:glycosyltransferase family 39 protein [Chloroflexota bacterium]
MNRFFFTLPPSPFPLRWAWIALLLVAYAVRLHHLDFESFWTDEATVLYEIGLIVQNPATLLAPGFNAGTYWLVLGAWTAAAGGSDYAIRYASLIFGLPVVVLTFVVAARLVDRRTAWMAAALAAGSSFLIYYSQEARAYAFLAFVSMLAIYLLTRVLAEPCSRRWWMAYVGTAAILPLTHIFGTLAMGCQLIYLGGRLWRRSGARTWLALTPIAAVFLLLLAWRGPAALARLKWDSAIGELVLAVFQRTGRDLSLWWAFPGDTGEPREDWAVWLALPLLIGLVGLLRDGRPAARSAGLWLVGALVLLPPIARGIIMENDTILAPPRYLIFAVPLFLMVVAAGIRWLGRRRPSVESTLVAAFVAVSLVPWWETHVGERRVREDWRGAVRAVERSLKSGDIGLFPEWQTRAAYGHYTRRDLDLLTLKEAPTSVESLLGGYLGTGRQLVTVSHYFGLALSPDDWLAERALKLQEVVRPPLALTRYLLEPFPRYQVPSIEHSSPKAFAGNVSVLGFDPLPDEDEGRLAVALHWQARNPISYPVLSSLLIEDKDGTVWAASHEVPTHGFYPATSWLPGQILRDERELALLPGTPAGSYTLRLGLRRADTEEVLPVLGPDGSPTGAFATLGSVTLTPSWRGARPPAGSLPVQGRTDAGLRLEAVMLPDAGRGPGQAMTLTSFWRLGGPSAELRLGIELRASDGRTYVSPTTATLRAPAGGEADQLLAQRTDFLLPAELPPGSSSVALRLSSAGGEPVAFYRGWLGAPQPTLSLGSMEVLAGPEPATIPVQATRVKQPWLDSIFLAAFTMDPAREIPAGGSLTVTLYWSASRTPEKSHTVFVHLRDPGGRLVAQHDGPPAEGAAPTTGWLPGQTIADPHRLVLPLDIAPGTYSLSVGLYEPSSGKRLARPGGADTASLGQIDVR